MINIQMKEIFIFSQIKIITNLGGIDTIINGVDKIFSLGLYPAISQLQARDKAREYNILRRSGIDLADYIDCDLQ